MSCIYKINIGTYTKEIESTCMKVYPSQSYFTPKQIEEEIMELIKVNENTKELSIFTNSPYVINTFTLISKIALVYTTYNKLNDTSIISHFNKLKWYVGGYNFNYLDSELIENGVTLNKEYWLFTDNNILNNSLNDFNNRYSDLLDIESKIILSKKTKWFKFNKSFDSSCEQKERMWAYINETPYQNTTNSGWTKINMGLDFNKQPGTCNDIYYYSGEYFYESILEVKFNKCLLNKEILEINLDDCYGISTHFLYITFGRLSMVFGKKIVLNHLKIISTEDPMLINQIKNIINNTV